MNIRARKGSEGGGTFCFACSLYIGTRQKGRPAQADKPEMELASHKTTVVGREVAWN